MIFADFLMLEGESKREREREREREIERERERERAFSSEVNNMISPLLPSTVLFVEKAVVYISALFCVRSRRFFKVEHHVKVYI